MSRKKPSHFKYSIRKNDHFNPSESQWITGLLAKDDAEVLYHELTNKAKTSTLHSGRCLISYELIAIPLND